MAKTALLAWFTTARSRLKRDAPTQFISNTGHGEIRAMTHTQSSSDVGEHSEGQQDLSDSNDCVTPTHPVPPEEIARYSPTRDPVSETDIANYVEGQAGDEVIQHVEKIKTEHVMGVAYEIWDVTTDKNRWWVISDHTNLYSQAYFPSMDYTLSFHIGLMTRIASRNNSADPTEPEPFDEVVRRQAQASDRHDQAIEAEDYQAVGMLLRECLISLISAMRRRVTFEDVEERPQDANFKAWSELLMNQLCSGNSNKELRQYLKRVSERTWQLVNWLTHDRDANQTASSIALHACDTLIGHFVQILLRAETDNTETCPVCSSRNLRIHFEIMTEPDGAYYSTCGECGWSSHPSLASQNQSSL